MIRDWSDAIAKCSAEGRCRACDRRDYQVAHVAGRRYDQVVGRKLYVHPDDAVPLCVDHHQAFDAHSFDLLPYLSLAEQARVVLHLGIVRAFKRVTGTSVVVATGL